MLRPGSWVENIYWLSRSALFTAGRLPSVSYRKYRLISFQISPLTTVRVSAEPGATARCFEWSPAAADTLVAAASDRSLITVAVKAEVR